MKVENIENEIPERYFSPIKQLFGEVSEELGPFVRMGFRFYWMEYSLLDHSISAIPLKMMLGRCEGTVVIDGVMVNDYKLGGRKFILGMLKHEARDVLRVFSEAIEAVG